MTYDPLSKIIDESLNIDATVMRELGVFREKAHFVNLPGVNPTLERYRLLSALNGLVDALIKGVQANPTKLWVMTEFQRYLVLVESEDTEGREHFGAEVEEIMDILGIESSDGLLTCYLGGV